MKIDATKLGLSMGGTAAILWSICSALVVVQPALMMTITGYMVHVNMDGFSWKLTWVGYIVGLVAWTICAAAAGWLTGWIYGCFHERSGD